MPSGLAPSALAGPGGARAWHGPRLRGAQAPAPARTPLSTCRQARVGEGAPLLSFFPRRHSPSLSLLQCFVFFFYGTHPSLGLSRCPAASRVPTCKPHDHIAPSACYRALPTPRAAPALNPHGLVPVASCNQVKGVICDRVRPFRVPTRLAECLDRALCKTGMTPVATRATRLGLGGRGSEHGPGRAPMRKPRLRSRSLRKGRGGHLRQADAADLRHGPPPFSKGIAARAPWLELYWTEDRS